MSLFGSPEDPEEFLTELLVKKPTMAQRLVNWGVVSTVERAQGYVLYGTVGIVFLVLIASIAFFNIATQEHSLLSPQQQAQNIQQMKLEAQRLNQ